ncbi:hypothetical protein HK098_005082 [Nowakowskiella sp. JEL0407]|nr:hypothetical protein HK098_005082 [Nowakowskiella sp. JEL0407]
MSEPEKLSVSSKSKELNTSIPTPLVYDKDVGPQLPSKSDTPVYYETYDYSYNTNVTSLQNEDGNEAIESSNTSNNPPLEDTELVRLAGRKAIKSGDVQIKDIALADQLDNSYEMEVLRNASKERDKIRSTMAGAHRQQPVGRRRNLTTLVNQALIRDADMQEAAATRRAMQKKIRAQYGF